MQTATQTRQSRGGRPALPPDLKRTGNIGANVTPAEKDLSQQRWSDLGYNTESDYLRELVLADLRSAGLITAPSAPVQTCIAVPTRRA